MVIALSMKTMKSVNTGRGRTFKAERSSLDFINIQLSSYLTYIFKKPLFQEYLFTKCLYIV